MGFIIYERIELHKLNSRKFRLSKWETLPQTSKYSSSPQHIFQKLLFSSWWPAMMHFITIIKFRLRNKFSWVNTGFDLMFEERFLKKFKKFDFLVLKKLYKG